MKTDYRSQSRPSGGCIAATLVSTVLLVSAIARASLATETNEPVSLSSPDGHLRVEVHLSESGGKRALVYQVHSHGRVVVAASSIRFEMANGKIVGDHFEHLQASTPQTQSESWTPVYGERSTIEDHFRSTTVSCRDAVAGHSVDVDFRCYNAGIAFRCTLAGGAGQEVQEIKEELSEFNFDGDPTVWRTTNAQGLYEQRVLSSMGRDVERPLTLELTDGSYVALAEACLVDYARTNLRSSPNHPHGAVTDLAGPVRFRESITTPWRAVLVADSPGGLLEQNDLVLNLNQPCEIEDTSWIKPGKVLREMTLTTAGGKAAIDFAHDHQFGYVEFDAGWYGHEYDDESDATTITLDPGRSAGPFDLHELIEYGREREIGIIVYVNRRALETQLDELLPLYKRWGIKGVKYGFVKVGSQESTRWLHEAIRKAAECQLMVDIHDEYRPTGYSRTYPNLMTQEGVRGDEATPSTKQALITLFTRSLAGATDFTVCYFDDRVEEHWSHAQQLAKPICFYSPWQFLFWYDTPLAEKRLRGKFETIQPGPGLEFFASLPTTWDDTRVLEGSIGEYAVVARRSGDEWFIGAINGEKAHQLEVPMSFLSPETRHTAHIYQDAPPEEPTPRIHVSQRQVDVGTTITMQLAANGGQAIRLVPMDDQHQAAKKKSLK